MVGQKTFETILEYYRFALWVVEKHPSIFTEYILRRPDPICPKCKDELFRVHLNPEYWLCSRCIKGYTREEIENASVQEEDNAPNGL